MKQIEIAAQKVSAKGKARFRLDDGAEGFAEEIALHSLRLEGWDGLWAENAYWWQLMALLFWDVIFARVGGAGFSELDSLLPTPRDMPMDFFTEDFYRRRQHLVGERLKMLRTSDLVRETLESHGRHYGKPCRPIENWDRFTAQDLAEAPKRMRPEQLLGLLSHLITDFNANRRGFPDLFLWKDQRVRFAEVKSPRDSLSASQRGWLDFLSTLGLEVAVVRILPQQTATTGSEKQHAIDTAVPAGFSIPTVEVPKGVFWADHLKTVRDRPLERLGLCLQFLPLPGAFREAAVALRTLIREKRRAGEDYGHLLGELYSLAAKESFLLSSPTVGDYPAYNVAEIVPRSALDRLRVSYQDVGYAHLPLLKPTDRKWLIESWGEPSSHRTVREANQAVWDKYVAKWRDEREAEEERSRQEWRDLLELEARTPQVEAPRESAGCLGLLILLTAGAGIALGVVH